MMHSYKGTHIRRNMAITLAALALSAAGLGGVATAGETGAPAPAKTAALPPMKANAAGTASAAADPSNCGWPRVCFYTGNKTGFLAAYQDMGYQNLTATAKRGRYIYNSRDDDGTRIYARHTNGTTSVNCWYPNEGAWVASGWTVYAINIVDSPSC